MLPKKTTVAKESQESRKGYQLITRETGSAVNLVS